MSIKAELFKERLNRYLTALDGGKPDKVPISFSVAEWAVKYTERTLQEVFYSVDIAVEITYKTLEEILNYADFDIFGGGPSMWWPPMFDAIGSKLYRFPGIHLDENTTFQYVEEEYMQPEGYDDFIADPTRCLLLKYLPRINEEFAEPGSYRALVALIKSAAAYAMFNNMMAEGFQSLTQKYGFVPGMSGLTKAPFDTLGDSLRGTKGILLDLRRRPDKVLAACKAIVPHNIAYAMIGAGGDTTFPCGMPLHKGAHPFLNRDQWEKFYWPTLKEVIEGLWARGKRTWFFAEGDWTPYLDRIAELPDKSIVFVIDLTDPQKA
ncbi:MAG: uroporphyrinogen decarboxylase family protein, partial [Moorellaceae bacterium]